MIPPFWLMDSASPHYIVLYSRGSRFFLSGRDASHSEIYLIYIVHIPVAPQETVKEPGSNPELLCSRLV
jgi:hypothetical protein